MQLEEASVKERDDENNYLSSYGTIMRTPSSQKILFIMHEPQTCSGRIGQWFCKNNYQIDIKKPRWGDTLPTCLDDYDGVVIFGGNMSVNDPLDFIKTEIDWLSVPFLEKKPVLGICLGAQLMVKNLGGHVFPHHEGVVEAGYFPVSLPKKSLVTNPALVPRCVYEWHKEGFDLPRGMHCFLQGHNFKNQAVLYDDCHVGLQFHPEITERILRRWITLMPEMLVEKGSQPALVQIKQHLAQRTALSEWLDHFLTAWCAKNIQS